MNENLVKRLNECDISVIANRYLQTAKYNTFVCPKCGSGTHGNNNTGMSIDNRRNKIHCFNCGIDWSVIDIILHCENLSNSSSDFIEALKIGCQIYGLHFEENKFTPTSAKTSASTKNNVDNSDAVNATDDSDTAILPLINADIIDAQKHIDELPLEDRRGLTIDTLKHFGVGFIANWIYHKNRMEGKNLYPTRRIIIPTGDCLYHYNAILPKRDRNDSNKKNKSMNAGSKEIFNSAAIVPNKIVIVTEGELDAMSIYQATGGSVNVVALGGAASKNITEFFQAINPIGRLNYKVLILFDADKTGRDNAQKLLDALINLNCPATAKFFTEYESKLDANDILINEGDAALMARVDKIISAAQIELKHAEKILFSLAYKLLPTLRDTSEKPKLPTLSNFFKFQFGDAVLNFLKFSERTSGFKNFDDAQMFNPGLYVIGGTPACGKTTFCWQLMEQFANHGENCVFFSYELSLGQLAAKSLARQLFIENPSTILSSNDILRGGFSNGLGRILDNYRMNDIPLTFWQCSTENVDELLSLIKSYCNDTDKPPIVCIDYLQIIPASTDKPITDKQRLDDIVRKLKVFQRETNTTFIIISSFNRMHYNVGATLESFKETGGIEYTADVVLALELWKNATDTSSMRELSMRQPRKIQLTCLKNRFGAMYDVFFEYYSRHDYFQPANDFNAVKKTDSANVER